MRIEPMTAAVDTVELSVVLTPLEAHDWKKFLTYTGFSDYLACADHESEARRMMAIGARMLRAMEKAK